MLIWLGPRSYSFAANGGPKPSPSFQLGAGAHAFVCSGEAGHQSSAQDLAPELLLIPAKPATPLAPKAGEPQPTSGEVESEPYGKGIVARFLTAIPPPYRYL